MTAGAANIMMPRSNNRPATGRPNPSTMTDPGSGPVRMGVSISSSSVAVAMGWPLIGTSKLRPYSAGAKVNASKHEVAKPICRMAHSTHALDFEQDCMVHALSAIAKQLFASLV
jgi:hypothetical protein